MTESHERFDELIAALDGPMVIVTAAHDGERTGCLVGFHGQCSIGPRRYAVWLSKANHTIHLALRATHLAVHFVTEADHDLAELFGSETGDEIDKFTRCEWTDGPHGVPLLDRCEQRIVLVRTSLVDEGGDHVCFVGEPVEVSGSGDFTPLRISAVSDLDPGHEPDDHP